MTGRVPTIVVSGYASVDYAMQLAKFEGEHATTMVRSRAEEWPRYGGVAHVTRAVVGVAGGGAEVVALSWVGPDHEGEAWTNAVREGGARVDGVAVHGTRSPSSHLLYPEGSSTICLFDPADCHQHELTAAQRQILADADVAVVAVGPADLTRELVNAVPSESPIVWTVKHDPSSLPVDLTELLAERSRLVTLSSEESAYLEPIARAAKPGTFVARTRGAGGAELLVVKEDRTLESVGFVPTSTVSNVDTTGAGDTFAGVLAVRLATQPNPTTSEMLEFIASAVSAATHMLAARAGAASDELETQHQEEE